MALAAWGQVEEELLSTLIWKVEEELRRQLVDLRREKEEAQAELEQYVHKCRKMLRDKELRGQMLEDDVEAVVVRALVSL